MEEKKAYKTAARTKITDFLKKNAERTVTVHDILEGLAADELDINISTVYRYLGKLKTEGLVNKYVADKGEMALYQYAGTSRNCEKHIHMKCVKCGQIIHLECDFMDELAGHIREHHGFEILCKGSVLYGTCSNCAQEGGNC